MKLIGYCHLGYVLNLWTAKYPGTETGRDVKSQGKVGNQPADYPRTVPRFTVYRKKNLFDIYVK